MAYDHNQPDLRYYRVYSIVPDIVRKLNALQKQEQARLKKIRLWAKTFGATPMMKGNRLAAFKFMDPKNSFRRLAPPDPANWVQPVRGQGLWSPRIRTPAGSVIWAKMCEFNKFEFDAEVQRVIGNVKPGLIDLRLVTPHVRRIRGRLHAFLPRNLKTCPKGLTAIPTWRFIKSLETK